VRDPRNAMAVTEAKSIMQERFTRGHERVSRSSCRGKRIAWEWARRGLLADPARFDKWLREIYGRVKAVGAGVVESIYPLSRRIL
jgi:hypothetical protein